MINGDPLDGRPARTARRLLWGLGALLAAMLLATAALQSQLDRLIGETGRLRLTGVEWNFFQLSYELHRLQDDLDGAIAGEAAPTPTALERLRQRYEIFISRIALIDPQQSTVALPGLPEHAQTLQALQDFVQAADRVLDPQRDPPPTREALQALRGRAAVLTEPVQSLARAASRSATQRAEQVDTGLREHQRQTLTLVLVQSLTALGFAALLVWQLRAAARRQDELADLAHRLDAARAAAEVAHQGKRLFLANMSHELRTPFNGVLGMLDLLDDHRLDADQRRTLRTARESTEQLLALLNDILDLSRLEDGQITLHPAPVDLRSLLASVHTAMRPAAEAKGLRLALQVDDAVPRAVLADGTRLRQVLLKLLSNAIKFTEAGDVQLQIAPKAPPAGAVPAAEGWLAFRVRDTGIGIAPAAQARLFERFAQGDDSVTRIHGGAGVGLRIARSLARLMGGDIRVVSETGVGSEFSLELPLPAVDAAGVDPPAAPPPAPRPRRLARPLDVLVAEDHAVNRQYFELLLERDGHRVRFAADGAEAVAEAERAPPDLVLMDLHMPVLDGIAAIRALRSRPAPVGRVRIVAVTADADGATHARAAEAGADAHLTKPFRPGELEATLLELFGDDGPSPALAPAPPTADARAPGEPELLDVRALGELCGLIRLEGVRPLLEGFFADEAHAYADLLDGLERADRASLPTRAHRFKGSAQLLGCAALAARAAAIESQCAGWGAGEATQAAAALRRQWADTRTLCQRLGLLGGEAGA